MKPWCPWCAGFTVRQAESSSTSGLTVALVGLWRITFTVTAHPHYLFWTANPPPAPPHRHTGSLFVSLSGSTPCPAPPDLPFLSTYSARLQYNSVCFLCKHPLLTVNVPSFASSLLSLTVFSPCYLSLYVSPLLSLSVSVSLLILLSPWVCSICQACNFSSSDFRPCLVFDSPSPSLPTPSIQSTPNFLLQE